MKKVVILIFVMSLFGAFEIAYAQQKAVSEEKIEQNMNSGQAPLSFYQKNRTGMMLSPSFQIGGEAFPDPERNFNPLTNISYAGDIDGDGRDDFYYTVYAANETTSDPTDRLTKLVVLYGADDGVSEANSDLVRDGFSFVTDVTGDGVPEAVKYEDGTLYLVVDQSSGDLQTLVDVELLELSYSIDYGTYGDFGGDGLRDIIVYDGGGIGYNQPHEFYVINGANDLSGVTVDTLSYMNNAFFRYDKMVYGDVDNDGTVELVQVSSLSTDGQVENSLGIINIYQLNNADSLELMTSDTLSSDVVSSYSSIWSGEIGLVDLNGDSQQELIISADEQLRIFELSSTAGEYYSEANVRPEVYTAYDFSIIDDFNDDGSKELLIIGDTDQFVTSDANLNLTNTDLPIETDDSIGLPENLSENRDSGGDVNGDGISDIVVEFSNPTTQERGYRVHFGNASGSLTDSSTNYIDTSVVFDHPDYVFNAGDFNDDGQDDYGIIYSSRSEVHIFYGGGTFMDNPVPDMVIEYSDMEGLYAPGVGDFNGDGVSDLLISKSRTGLETNDARLDIFFGGGAADNISDHSINFSDVYPDTSGNIGNANSIGDINNDGADDIMFASEQFRENAHIVFGGSSIGTGSDLELPFFPWNFSAAGDFNDDGFNDFAVMYDNTIYIHSGFDGPGGASFDDTPIITIPAPQYDGTTVFTSYSFFGHSMTHGDFNGDMISDFAFTSVFHTDYSTGSLKGAEAIRIYEGSSSPDTLVDGKIYIRAADFSGSEYTGGLDTLSSNIGSIAATPDQNGDGKAELLFAGYGFGLSNAAVYYGGDLDTMGTNIATHMEAPNQARGLGPYNNYIYAGRGVPAVGDFNGDDKNDYILPQLDDFNYPVDPVYIYTSDQFAVGNEEEIASVNAFRLNQNYPNPFNPTTRISYTLPSNGEVKLQVFDITGRLVSTVLDQRQTAGSYTLNFDASHLASGIYIYRLKASGLTKTRKMTLIK